MPMSSTAASAALKAALLANPNSGAVDNAALTALCDEIAAVVVATVQTATVTVSAGIPVATAGTAVAQTGATTGPGVGVIT